MSLLEILGIVIAVLIIAGLVTWWLRRSPGAGLTDDERVLLKAKKFDRYTLRRVRKRAVLSTMYQAADSETKAAVALRILRSDLAVDPDQVKAFKRRGEIIEYLNKEHPDLPFVRLLRYGQFKAGRTVRPFIAVEYFEGQDLGELLEEKKALPVAEAIAIVTQVARALGVVLREKVWHHQMTLQAVMVRSQKGGDPEAKLVDFDLARQEIGGTAGTADARLIFMSPEQFENKIVDDRSDVYSLGALCYLLLTGRPPFAGADYAEMARLQKTPPPPLPASIPEPVRALVLKMLQRQPQDRFRSMDEVLDACKRLEIQPSWHAAPDTTGVRPIAAPVLPAEAAAPRQERVRLSEREPAPRKFGGAANILREVVAFVVSPFARIFSKLTPVKIVIGLLVLVVAGVAYLFLRSNDVSGEITIQVAGSKGAPLSGAAVVIEPAPGGGKEPSVKFTDVLTDASMKGKLEAKTTAAGTLKLKYSVTPGTRFGVRVSAPEYLDRADSLVIGTDTTYSLTYALALKPVAAPMTVFVHDKARNPIGSVIVRIVGKSGKEYTLTTDARGKASLEINPAAEGNAPEVSLSAPSLGTDFAQSTPRKENLTGSGMNIDVNDYFPFDQTLDRSIREAEGFIRNKDWEKARTPLLKAVQLRPGQGSARAYTYLAQAWMEDDKDNYRETQEAAKKAIADEGRVTGPDRTSVIEKMHFYEVKALYEAWRDNKTASNKQETLVAARRYLAMMKGPAFAGALKKNKVMEKHRDDVADFYDDVK